MDKKSKKLITSISNLYKKINRNYQQGGKSIPKLKGYMAIARMHQMNTIKKTAAWLWCTEKNDERKSILKKYFYNKWGYNESENSTDNT